MRVTVASCLYLAVGDENRFEPRVLRGERACREPPQPWAGNDVAVRHAQIVEQPSDAIQRAVVECDGVAARRSGNVDATRLAELGGASRPEW